MSELGRDSWRRPVPECMCRGLHTRKLPQSGLARHGLAPADAPPAQPDPGPSQICGSALRAVHIALDSHKAIGPSAGAHRRERLRRESLSSPVPKPLEQRRAYSTKPSPSPSPKASIQFRAASTLGQIDSQTPCLRFVHNRRRRVDEEGRRIHAAVISAEGISPRRPFRRGVSRAESCLAQHPAQR